MEEPQSPQDAASGAGGESPQEPPEEPQAAGEGAEGGILADPMDVFEELGELQENARRDTTKTIELLPGRFRGRLAVRVKRIDPKDRRRKAKKIAKRGITTEAELQYAAEIVAEATDAILYRPKDSDVLVEAQTISPELGDTPIKWERRLGVMIPTLGAVLSGSESEASVVRLLFKNPEALDAFYGELDAWLREALPEDDEEDEGPAERPI